MEAWNHFINTDPQWFSPYFLESELPLPPSPCTWRHTHVEHHFHNRHIAHHRPPPKHTNAHTLPRLQEPASPRSPPQTKRASSASSSQKAHSLKPSQGQQSFGRSSLGPTSRPRSQQSNVSGSQAYTEDTAPPPPAPAA
jgi:hypothetical protein